MKVTVRTVRTVRTVYILSCLPCCLSSPVLWPPGASVSPPSISLSPLSTPPLPSLVLQSSPLSSPLSSPQSSLPQQSETVHLPPLSAEYQVPYRPSITFLDPPVLPCLQCQYQCTQCQHCHLHQEAETEVSCQPVSRQVCSSLPSFVSSHTEDVCDSKLETVCTTITATKYVKWCERSSAGVLECAQYPVQKPVVKCAEVPQQTCVRSRLKQKCRSLIQNVCRKVAIYKPTKKCETYTGSQCNSEGLTCLKTEKICSAVSLSSPSSQNCA